MSNTPQPSKEGLQSSTPAIIILPLRLFLGLIFFFAGIDKLTDSTFLDPNNANFIGKQLQGFVDYNHSPISFLLTSIAIPNARLFGIMISLTELIVGVLVVLGLFTRLAAALGLVLNTSLWLTASWGATPFYTGWDLPYMFGWLTLLLAGAGPFSLDYWRAMRSSALVAVSDERRNFLVRGGATLGAIFALAVGGGVAVTGLLTRSNSSSGSTGGGSANPQPTGTGAAQLEPTAAPPAIAATNTPQSLPMATATSASSGIGPSSTPAGGATDTPLPQLVAPTDTTASQAAAPTSTRLAQPPPTRTQRPQAAPTSTHPPQPAPTSTRPQPASTATNNTPPVPPTATTGGDINPGSTPAGGATDTPIAAPTPIPAGGVVIGKVSNVPPGSGLRFTDPTTQNDAWVVHLSSGSFVGFSAVCTHLGCSVNYNTAQMLFVCPCHGSEYDPAQNARVVRPPAPRPLAKIQIRVDESSGNIYYVSD